MRRWTRSSRCDGERGASGVEVARRGLEGMEVRGRLMQGSEQGGGWACGELMERL